MTGPDPWAELAGWAAAAGVIGLLCLPLGARLLSSRVRFIRGTIAFVTGSLLGYVLLGVFVIRESWHWYVGVIFVAITALSVLAMLTILELLFGRSARLRPLIWGRELIEAVRDIRRYVQVLRIVATHGLGRYLRSDRATDPTRTLGMAIAASLEEAGTTFIKLGQVLAVREDLAPAAIRSELARLHDRVAPIPSSTIRAALGTELGADGTHLLATLDDHPVATASVAQVHRAELADGTPVAVKVQRPDIVPQIDRDLQILARLARRLERRTTWARRARATAFVEEFAKMLREELDFRIEASNAEAIHRGLPPGPVAVVTVHTPLTTRTVLVMDYVEGRSIADATPGLAPDERSHLADALLAEALREILVLGVFHADPHPGNVLLTHQRSLVLIDFGSAGHLDARTRDGLSGALLAIRQRNATRLADAILTLSVNATTADRETLEAAMRDYLRANLRAHQSIDVTAVRQVFEIAIDLDIELASELGGVMRAVAVLDGTLRVIDPGYSLLDGVARAVDRGDWIATGMRDRISADFSDLTAIARRLPRRVDRILSEVESGRLSFGARVFADPGDRRFVRDLVHLTLHTLLVIASGVIGVALLAIPQSPEILPGIETYDTLGYGFLLAGSVLLLRVLVVLSRAPERGDQR